MPTPPYVGQAMSGLAKLGQAEWANQAQTTIMFGAMMATYWKSQEALAIVGQLPRAKIQELLHRREIVALMIRRGWLHGMVERLLADGENAVVKALAANQGSVVNRALQSGQLDYPAAVIAALPGMFTTLGDGITVLRTTAPAAAAALAANQGSVVGRALMSGQLDYPATVVAALPGMLTTLGDGIAALRPTAPAVADVLAANQGSVVSRALHLGQLDYPATVVAMLQNPAAWRAQWAAQVAALQVADAKAAAQLEHDAAWILGHALRQGLRTPSAAIESYYRI